MSYQKYTVPVGDILIREAECSFVFRGAFRAMCMGRPFRPVRGQIWLTGHEFAFRATDDYWRHPNLTFPRSLITASHVFRPKILGFIPGGKPQLEIELPDRSFYFEVAEPESWVQTLQQPILSLADPVDRLNEALAAGVSEVGRYRDVLYEQSFPWGFWHVEALDDMFHMVESRLEDLGLSIPPEWLRALDLDVEPLNSHEIGPGSEAWCRREQILRICEAVNAAEFSSDHRFYEFEETLPHWEYDEPVWLWLSNHQRNRLLELGVLSEVSKS